MKKILTGFLFLLSTGFFLSLSAQEKKTSPLRTLIIDPGHGGMDPGAKGTLESEANVALAISLKLGDTIAKAFPDIKIIYTRTTDILPGNHTNLDASLKYRANLANENNGDLFIAIHCNSAGKQPGGW
jgi:N-acetylmuramoyl-L-alanine amidase